MDGWRNGDALPGHVQPQIFQTEIIDLSKVFPDFFLTQKGDVQIDLRGRVIDAFGNNVPRHQISLFTVFILHEIDAAVSVKIIEASAVAARAFRDQHALLRCFNGGGMVLDEFQVFQLCSLQKQHAGGVPVAEGGAGGFSEQTVLPSCGDHNIVGIKRNQTPVYFIIKKRAAADTVGDQGGVEHKPVPAKNPAAAFPFPRFLHQGGDDLFSGGSSGIDGAFAGLAAERPSGRLPVLSAGEDHADALQPGNDMRGVLTEGGHRFFPCDHQSAFQRFPDMKLNAVLAVAAGQNGVDSSRGHDGLGTFGGKGGDQNSVISPPGRFNGAGEAGNAAADNEYLFHGYLDSGAYEKGLLRLPFIRDSCLQKKTNDREEGADGCRAADDAGKPVDPGGRPHGADPSQGDKGSAEGHCCMQEHRKYVDALRNTAENGCPCGKRLPCRHMRIGGGVEMDQDDHYNSRDPLKQSPHILAGVAHIASVMLKKEKTDAHQRVQDHEGYRRMCEEFADGKIIPEGDQRKCHRARMADDGGDDHKAQDGVCFFRIMGHLFPL